MSKTKILVFEHDQNFLTTGTDATSQIDWMENSDILILNRLLIYKLFGLFVTLK